MIYSDDSRGAVPDAELLRYIAQHVDLWPLDDTRASERLTDMAKEIESAAGSTNDCRCGKNPAEEPHACPFRVDVHDNSEPCTCCDECRRQCALDI